MSIKEKEIILDLGSIHFGPKIIPMMLNKINLKALQIKKNANCVEIDQIIIKKENLH